MTIADGNHPYNNDDSTTARGAVYAIGRNDRGQLGLHDKEHRYAFCMLKELYDGIIVRVVAGASLTV